MKSLKEQLVNESNNKVWLLNNGIIVPADDGLLKYDDSNYINETKLLHLLESSNKCKKALSNSINDFTGSLEILWKGNIDEYLPQMFN